MNNKFVYKKQLRNYLKFLKIIPSKYYELGFVKNNVSLFEEILKYNIEDIEVSSWFSRITIKVRLSNINNPEILLLKLYGGKYIYFNEKKIIINNNLIVLDFYLDFTDNEDIFTITLHAQKHTKFIKKIIENKYL